FIRKEFLSKIVKEVIGVEDVYFVANSYVQTMEKFKLSGVTSKKVKVKENGILFEVIIGEGYKTGFFCDQRENRKYLAQFANNKNVLDLFSYTGGFGIYLAKHGAKEVSCVELDEEACRMAKRNSNINSVKINVIRADAFNYLRQMIMNKKKFDIVICDPYKFISSKENMEEGLKKYQDINRLALEVVKSGGILVSCSCSGMLSFNQFISIIKSAASSAKRIVKIFKKSGAGPDHPYMVNYPEGEYLKVLWSFVE
ncbi:MAG: class I SAM-dependent methyltransferase, partial [Elusimicrobiales bacterium]|nr:class I SAM-dependent methyltransferase [Elusimicrobiales bacterium]